MTGRLIALFVVVVAVAYVLVQVLRPLPAVTAHTVAAPRTVSHTTATLSWPSTGEAAVGVEGTGVVESHGSAAPTPLASVAKVMTAYIVLRDHPLTVGDAGPAIPITTADASLYQQEEATGDSAVAVQAGESLSELQALEALLLPSGDNIALLLADWDAGSEAAFVAKMNDEARTLGLSHTHYADPAGVDSDTTGTAADQVRLAMIAMRNPVFAQIVAMAQVTLPVAGVQYNVDALVGSDGIVGVKTGWTTAAGGCFVFAADTTLSGHAATVVGAVLHQAAGDSVSVGLNAAFSAASSLLTSAGQALVAETVTKGATLGRLDAPWATPVALRAASSVTLYGAAGMALRTRVDISRRPTLPISAGEHLGTAVVTLGGQRARLPLVAARDLSGASLSWRLTHL